MSKIQIICSKPGIRRNGVEHPAQAVYDAGRWTDKELEAFRADPAFIVLEAADSTSASDDIKLAVLVEIERKKLEAGFNKAVADAVAEKLADTKAEHDNAIDALGKKLEAAEAEIATLKSPPATGSEDQQPDAEAGGAGDGKKTAKK